MPANSRWDLIQGLRVKQQQQQQQNSYKYDIPALLDNIVNVLQKFSKHCRFDRRYVMRNKILFTGTFILLKYWEKNNWEKQNSRTLKEYLNMWHLVMFNIYIIQQFLYNKLICVMKVATYLRLLLSHHQTTIKKKLTEENAILLLAEFNIMT